MVLPPSTSDETVLGVAGTAYRNISEAWKTCKVHFDLETSDIGICELEAACARKLSDCDKRRNPVTGFELIKREIPQRFVICASF